MEAYHLAILSYCVPPAISLLAGLAGLGGWAKYLFAAVLGLAGALGQAHLDPQPAGNPWGGDLVGLPLLCIVLALGGSLTRQATRHCFDKRPHSGG
jgi:hypothetical protein